MPPRAAKKPRVTKKANPKTKPKQNVPENEVVPGIAEEEKTVVEEVVLLKSEEDKNMPENEVTEEEKKVVEEVVLSKSEVATEVEVFTVEETKDPKSDEFSDSKDPKLEELSDSKDLIPESVDAEGEASEEPEEIAGGVNESELVQMDQAQGVEQETIEEGTGVGKVEDIKGGGVDGTGADGGGDEVKDDDKSESDDDEEMVDLEDPSVYMHAPLTERKKQKESEIFIGGLDKEAVEEDLIKVFSEFGEIQAVRIAKHPTSQKSKGFAFIRYATVEQALKALSELKDGTEVRGKRIGISSSHENDTLYVGNICKTWTKDHVLATLKGYAVEQIDEIFLPEDPKNEGKNRGFALLEFNTHSDAMAAFQLLRKPDAIFGCDRSAKVAFAQSPMHPSEEALLQVKTVFVEGLPSSWDEEKVKELCKQYGEIGKVHLSRNFSSAKRKDFGFIEFTSRESAIACVEGINSAELGEGDIKVKANLAKPQNKGRLAKQGARGGFKVKKVGESTEEVGNSKLKGNAQFKGAEGKGKARSKLRSAKGGKSFRQQGRVLEGQGGVSFEDPQRRGQPFKGGKRGDRGMDSDNSVRPSKKARNNRNIRGGPNNDFGNQRNPRFGKPKANFTSRPSGYMGPYTSGYSAPATSYQYSDYGASFGSNRSYSDMEPHAGYLEPAAKLGRVPYAYGQRSDVRTGAGYMRGPALPPAYAPGYSSYAGYEAGYGYPNNGAVYPARGPYY
ncbi:uncharacterized protein LOC143877391 isoform X2 [Tasmannia lanceolata]|uniref:uncharacterized protein LOC143877391 isoform X2 n=1 Tax=Tasmannia lanceolata TaxID=3420 RepID=UPI004064C267